jgi:predicted AlkP superfamily pyrophosphatase or phosphodiesterase
MSHLKVLSLFFVYLAAFVFSATGEEKNPIPSDRIVVLISVDGLAGFYMDDPKAEMPNIRALAAAGARTASMKPVAPTVTWPNHTTLVTGVTPARHGVVGNNYFDRAQKEQVTLIQDPVYDKDEIVKVPTIYDIAKSKGLKSASVIWPATRNARTLDWTVPEVRSGELLERYTTPGLMEECRKNGISFTEENFKSKGDRLQDVVGDDAYVRAFNLILHNHRPNLALLHLGNVDHIQHDKGPRSPEAYVAIKQADAQVGEVWRQLERDFAGRATLLVVSDHGFSFIKHIVLPNVVLRQAGLICAQGKKVNGGSVRVVVQGGAAMLYVLDQKNRDEVISQIKKAFGKNKGVAKVVGPNDLNRYGVANPKDDPNAPDVMLFAKDGYTFGDTAAGDLPFNEKPERFGSHGHDPNLPNLQATFVAWGVGVKSGTRLGKIENVSVAPTIAKLLGIPFPSADGKPLLKLLTK